MKPKPYRLQITESNYTTYLTRDDKGRVSYFNGSETPLALSNLVSNDAAETRFAMQDALNGSDASKKLRAILAARWRNNMDCCPSVIVLQ